MPRALNRWVAPAGTFGLAGVIDIEDRAAVLVVMVEVPEIFATVPVMVEVPAPTIVAKPLLLIVATVAFDEVQRTCEETSRLIPSENRAMPLYCWEDPTGMTSCIAMELIVETDDEDDDDPPPHVTRGNAKDPRNNMAQTNLIFFMRTPSKRHIPPNLV